MKLLLEEIPQNKANLIKTRNHEYLEWLDGTEITQKEIQNHFRVVQDEKGVVYLQHKTEDYYIPDIIF